MLDGTVAMPSSDWRRLVPSWGSRSGSISAAAWAFLASRPYSLSRILSAAAVSRRSPHARGFAPLTIMDGCQDKILCASKWNKYEAAHLGNLCRGIVGKHRESYLIKANAILAPVEQRLGTIVS